MKGDLDGETFVLLSGQFRKEREKNDNTMQKLQEQIQYTQNIAYGIERFGDVILEMTHIEQLIRDLLHQLINYIDIYPRNKTMREQKIQIHYFICWVSGIRKSAFPSVKAGKK